MVGPDCTATVQIVSPGPTLPLVRGGGHARAVIWPGMGASLRSMQLITLDAAASTVELRHDSEAVYYFASGSGSVAEPAGPVHELRDGSMFLVEPHTRYVVTAGAAGAVVIGGPCPPDPALYADVAER